MIILISLVSIVVFKFVYAYLIFDGADLPPCAPPPGCDPLTYEECINAQRVGIGQCGLPGCSGGEPWSRYKTTYQCKRINESLCAWRFTKIETWASTADKLEPLCQDQRCGPSKNGYLAGGSCDPKDSHGFYKVCCNGTVVEESGLYYVQDRYTPPTEGVCTVGRSVIVASGLDTTPNSGEPHPACIATKITCSSSKISSDTAQFIASSTEPGTIEISVSGNVIGTCTNATQCTANYTGSGTVQAKTSLKTSTGQTLSVDCPPVTLGGGTPPPPPPPPPPPAFNVPAGICGLQVKARLNGNPLDGATIIDSTQQFTKSSDPNTIQIDVKAENAGTSYKVADCYYKKCLSLEKITYYKHHCVNGDITKGCICYRSDEVTNYATPRRDCGKPNPEALDPMCCGDEVTEDHYEYQCQTWESKASGVTTIYNQAKCKSKSDSYITFKIGLEPNGDDSDIRKNTSETSQFYVKSKLNPDYRSIISSDFGTLTRSSR